MVTRTSLWAKGQRETERWSRTKTEIIMSWSSTQRAVFLGLGRVAGMTAKEQEAMRVCLQQQLDNALDGNSINKREQS